MKISVLVTYYNQEEFVKRSLESVLGQKTSHELEILVGDDGSLDGTQRIIKEYTTKYQNIALYVMPREKELDCFPGNRVSDNRLNLLSKATGDYVTFLDGDDFYINDSFLETGANTLKECTSLVGCAFGYATVSSESNVQIHLLSKDQGELSLAHYIADKYTHVGGILFRKPTIDKNLNFLAYKRLFSDNLITFLMLNYGQLYYIPEPVYGYWQHENSIWTSASNIEHNILNALDFNIARKLLPSDLEKYACLRYFNPIAYIYYRKNELENLLEPDILQKYRKMAFKLRSYFIFTLLHWNTATTFRKTCALQYFKCLRAKVKSMAIQNNTL